MYSLQSLCLNKTLVTLGLLASMVWVCRTPAKEVGPSAAEKRTLVAQAVGKAASAAGKKIKAGRRIRSTPLCRPS